MELTQKEKRLLATLIKGAPVSFWGARYVVLCLGLFSVVGDLYFDHRLSASSVLVTMMGVYLVDMLRMQSLISGMAQQPDVKRQIQGIKGGAYVRLFSFPVVVGTLAIVSLMVRWLRW
ncbi:MAG: hypothetical protein WCI03_08760 [bacterium]